MEKGGKLKNGKQRESRTKWKRSNRMKKATSRVLHLRCVFEKLTHTSYSFSSWDPLVHLREMLFEKRKRSKAECQRVNSNGGRPAGALSYKRRSESCPNGLCIAKCVFLRVLTRGTRLPVCTHKLACPQSLLTTEILVVVQKYSQQLKQQKVWGRGGKEEEKRC